MDQDKDRNELPQQLEAKEMWDDDDPVQPSPKPRRNRIMMAAGALALVLLLGAAAYQGGKMLAGPAPVEGAGGPVIVGGPAGTGAVVKSPGSGIEPSDELPATAPDLSGVLIERADNRLTVASNLGGAITTVMRKPGGSQGSGSGAARMGPSGGTTFGIGDGPQVEVVVTRETSVYRDVTEFRFEQAASGSSVKQKVELVTIDDIPHEAIVSVWGEKRGDRLVAAVILFW